MLQLDLVAELTGAGGGEDEDGEPGMADDADRPVDRAPPADGQDDQGDEGSEGSEGDPGKGADDDEEDRRARKVAPNDGLNKVVADMRAGFEAQLAELSSRLAKIAGEPAPAKGPLSGDTGALSKIESTGGEEALSDAQINDAMGKLAPTDRAIALAKISMGQSAAEALGISARPG